MGVQEWTIILGVVFGVTILLWMAARWRKRRYDEIYSGDTSDLSDLEDEYTSELPSGGARTVGYRDPSDIERMNSEIRERADSLKPRLSSFQPSVAPRKQQSLFTEEENPVVETAEEVVEEEQVPLLLDPSEEHSESQEVQEPETDAAEASAVAPNRAEDEDDAAFTEPESVSANESPEPEQNLAPESSSEEPLFVTEPDESSTPIENETLEIEAEPEAEPEPEIDLPLPEEETSQGDTSEAETESTTVEKNEPAKDKPIKAKSWNKLGRGRAKSQENKEPPKPQPSEPAEIVIINLMTAPETPYEGRALLRALNEQGMRFGEMDIFHYCGKHGDERPQFRMANLLNPGVFDMDKIDELRTHALCFFFELEPDQENMSVYEAMLSVITRLKDELGGEMRDDQRSLFTIQMSEHCRNRIRDFQRRHLVRKH